MARVNLLAKMPEERGIYKVRKVYTFLNDCGQGRNVLVLKTIIIN